MLVSEVFNRALACEVLRCTGPATSRSAFPGASHLWSTHVTRADARYVNDRVAFVATALDEAPSYSATDGNCEANEVCQQIAFCPTGDYYVLDGGFQQVDTDSQVLHMRAFANAYEVYVANDDDVDMFQAVANCIQALIAPRTAASP